MRQNKRQKTGRRRKRRVLKRKRGQFEIWRGQKDRGKQEERTEGPRQLNGRRLEAIRDKGENRRGS